MKNRKYLAALSVALIVLALSLMTGCGGNGGSITSTKHPAGPPPTGFMKFDQLKALLASGPVTAQMRLADGRERFDHDVTIRDTRVDGVGAELGLIKALSAPGAGPGCSGAEVIVNGKLALLVLQGHEPMDFEGVSAEQSFAEAKEFLGRSSKTALQPTKQPIRLFAPLSVLEKGQQWLDRAHATEVTLVAASTDGGKAANSRGGPGYMDSTTFVGSWSQNVYFGAHLTWELEEGNWLCTGHSIDGVGGRNLPVRQARGYQLADGSYALYPDDDFFGYLIYDGRYCGIVREEKIPPSAVTPITASYKDGSSSSTLESWVSRDRGDYFEHFSDFVELAMLVDRLFGLHQPGAVHAKLTLQVRGEDPQVFEEDLSGNDLMEDVKDWLSMNTYGFYSGLDGRNIVQSHLEMTPFQ